MSQHSSSAPWRAPAQVGARVARTRLWPRRRAALGALLLTGAVVTVFTAYARIDREPHTRYVVARSSIAPGSTLTPDDLATVPIDLPPETASRGFVDTDQLMGAVTLAPLDRGDLVLSSAVHTDATGLPEGGPDGRPARQFSFALDRDHAVDGDLRAGENVDVLATYGTGDGAYTVVAARQARVVTIGDGGSGGIGSTGTVVVTMALRQPEEVMAVAHASEVAAVTIVRATGAGVPLPDRYQAPGGDA